MSAAEETSSGVEETHRVANFTIHSNVFSRKKTERARLVKFDFFSLSLSLFNAWECCGAFLLSLTGAKVVARVFSRKA